MREDPDTPSGPNDPTVHRNPAEHLLESQWSRLADTLRSEEAAAARCGACGGRMKRDGDRILCEPCGVSIHLAPATEDLPAELPPDVAQAATRPDSRFDRYVLLEKLGSGGFGDVFLAYDTRLGRRTALKFMAGGGEEDRARFRREARVAAGLDHPNIASIFDSGETDGRCYISMQLVEGQTLQTVPRSDRRRLAEMVRDAARGIAYAHSRGVIHRDIKPANVMVDSAGKVYVLDFGLAKNLQDPGLSQTGTLAGTPSYMSPEQARAEPLDGRTDVWSLGATLFHLLAGAPPYPGKTPFEVLDRVIKEEPPRLRCGDARLDTIVGRAMEKERERRYASAQDLAEDIERWLRGDTILARPPGTLERARVFVRRHKVATAVAALAVVAAVAWYFVPGTVVVRVDPADAVVNGRPARGGVVELSLPAGMHTLTVEAADHEPATVDVAVRRWVTLERGVRLEHETGTLEAECPVTGSEIIVDGRAYGSRIPGLSFPTGERRVVVRAPGYFEVERIVRVRRDAAAVEYFSPESADVRIYEDNGISEGSSTFVLPDIDDDGLPELCFEADGRVVVAFPQTQKPSWFAGRPVSRGGFRLFRWDDRILLVSANEAGPPFASCLEPRTQRELWHQPIASRGRHVWAYLSGDLLILTSQSAVRLDPATGKILKGFEFDTPVRSGFPSGENRLIVHTASEIVGVDLNAGEAAWRADAAGARVMAHVDWDDDGATDAFVATGTGFSVLNGLTGAVLYDGTRSLPEGRLSVLPGKYGTDRYWLVADTDWTRVSGGRVGSNEGWERRIDKRNQFGGGLRLLPNGLLPLVTDRGIEAVDPRTGETRWTYAGRTVGMLVADADGDGVDELLAGMEEGPDLVCIDADGRRLWAFGLENSAYPVSTAADLDGDDLPEIVLHRDAWLTGLARAPRGMRWTRRADVGLMAPPVVSDFDGDGRAEVVSVGTRRGGVGLAAFDGATGRRTWGAQGGYVYNYEPAIDGREVVAVRDFGEHRMELLFHGGRDGREVGRFEVGHGAIYAVPAGADLDGDGVTDWVILKWDGHVEARSGSGGDVLWRHPLMAGLMGRPAIADLDGVGRADVVVGGRGTRRVHAIRGSDGGELWSTFLGASVLSPPALVEATGDGVPDIVVLPADGSVVLLDGRDGGEVWRMPGEPWGEVAAAAAVRDGIVVAPRGRLGLSAYEAASGRELWNLPVPVLAAPIVADIDADGRWEVVAPALDGCVYVVGLERGEKPGRVRVGPPGSPAWAAVGDLDGDGVLDVAVTVEKELIAIDGAALLEARKRFKPASDF